MRFSLLSSSSSRCTNTKSENIILSETLKPLVRLTQKLNYTVINKQFAFHAVQCISRQIVIQRFMILRRRCRVEIDMYIIILLSNASKSDPVSLFTLWNLTLKKWIHMLGFERDVETYLVYYISVVIAK